MAEKSNHFYKLPESLQSLIGYLIQSGVPSKIVLFGSRARGSARENSDYDFSVSVNDRSAWTRVRLEADEKNLTLLPVDLVLYEEVDIEYRKRIDSEGILIYG